MMPMTFTLKKRPQKYNSVRTRGESIQLNEQRQINQFYLQMPMTDRIKTNGEPCKSCGK